MHMWSAELHLKHGIGPVSCQYLWWVANIYCYLKFNCLVYLWRDYSKIWGIYVLLCWHCIVLTRQFIIVFFVALAIALCSWGFITVCLLVGSSCRNSFRELMVKMAAGFCLYQVYSLTYIYIYIHTPIGARARPHTHTHAHTHKYQHMSFSYPCMKAVVFAWL
jgi:hypothetical protein